MNEEFQRGDTVDITITDLEVIGVDGTRTDCDYIKVQKPWRDHLTTLHIPFDHPAVTITRRAPQPKAGDVWEHPTHGRMLFTDFSGDLWAWDVQESGHALSGLDMRGARRLYPPSALPVDAEAPMLRRFEENDGDVWVETAPASNEYQSEKSPSGSRGEIDGDYGIRRDLHSFPADDEAVR